MARQVGDDLLANRIDLLSDNHTKSIASRRGKVAEIRDIDDDQGAGFVGTHGHTFRRRDGRAGNSLDEYPNLAAYVARGDA